MLFWLMFCLHKQAISSNFPGLTAFCTLKYNLYTHKHRQDLHITAVQWLNLTSVIFTEAPRKSNHKSSVWKPECSWFCWAALLDSTPRRPLHRGHVARLPALRPRFKQTNTVKRRTRRATADAHRRNIVFELWHNRSPALWLRLYMGWLLTYRAERIPTAAAGASHPLGIWDCACPPTDWSPLGGRGGSVRGRIEKGVTSPIHTASSLIVSIYLS